MQVWTNIWWWWLLAVAVSFSSLELEAIIADHGQAFTLSDTIRRWSAKERWLAPLVIGFSAALLFHFFGQSNG
jgi:hypothetical protein